MKKATTYGNKMMVLDTEKMEVSIYQVKDIKEVFSKWEIAGDATETKPFPADRLAKFDELWISTGSRVI